MTEQKQQQQQQPATRHQGIFSCCSSSKATTESVIANTAASNDINGTARRERCQAENGGSVYVTAMESNLLAKEELDALKQLEAAADLLLTGHHPSSRESVYHDTSDNMPEDDWSYLLTYMPATTKNTHLKGTVSLSHPETLRAVPSAAHTADHKASVVRRRLSSIIGVLTSPGVKIDQPGYPGELIEAEVTACMQLRKELEGRAADSTDTNGKLYRRMVEQFHGVEEEPYALCRFLRARKFDVGEVMTMISEGVETWAEGERNQFFPDASVAIGNPVSVFRSQYPTAYSGIAKNGCPISWFKAGKISVEGLECVTTMEKLTDLSWHTMCHKFPEQVAKAQKRSSDAVRCEAIAVIDLAGLKASSLNSRTLECMKRISQINKCFPELLNCMVVMNAPAFFAFSWRIIRRFLDPRTAAKITIISDSSKGRAWISDRVDEDQILSDYGGTGPSFDEILQEEDVSKSTVAKRRIIELLSAASGSKSKKASFELISGDNAEFTVYSRSVAGCSLQIIGDGGEVVQETEIKSSGDADSPAEPFSFTLPSCLPGPGKFKLRACVNDCSSGTEPLEHFLVVGDVK